MSNRYQHFGDRIGPIQTTDSAARDTLLANGFLITPDTRILPEKAPATHPGDFGVRRTGEFGPAPTQVDIDRSDLGFDKAIELGLMTKEEAAKIRKILKSVSGRDPGVVPASGVASNQDRNLKTPAQALGPQAAEVWRAKDAEVRADIARMQKNNDTFWAEHAKKSPSYTA